MVESKLTQNQDSSCTFPKLMRSDAGVTILATGLLSDKLVGTVVHTSNSLYKIGHHSKEWNAHSFVDYKNEVILKTVY